MGATEKKVEREVKLAAQQWHPVGVLFRTAAGGGRPAPGAPWIEFLPPGWPDYTFIIRGRVVGVETKALKGRLEKSQVRMARTWWCAGCPVIAPRSGQEFVKGLGRVLPPGVLEPPSAEEIALFADAHSDEWKHRPAEWLKKQGAG